MAGAALVLLIEDHHSYARRVSQALGSRARVEHVDTLSDATAALGRAAFDLVILDAGLPDGDGLRFAETLARPRRSEIVILTGDATSDMRARADAIDVDCFEKGDLRADHLRQILAHHLDRAEQRRLGTEELKRAIASALALRNDLTRAETRVLVLVGLGLSRDEMAAELNVGVNCVKKHLNKIFSKLERVIPDRSIGGIERWILDQALYEAMSNR